MRKIVEIPLCGEDIDLGLCIQLQMPKDYRILSHRVVQNVGCIYVEIDTDIEELVVTHLHIVPAGFEFYADEHEFIAHWVLQNDDIEHDMFCFVIPEGSDWGYNSKDFKNRFSDLENLTDEDYRKLFMDE